MRVETGQFVAYYRVPTDQQCRSGLGLEAQREVAQRYLGSVGGVKSSNSLRAKPAKLPTTSWPSSNRPQPLRTQSRPTMPQLRSGRLTLEENTRQPSLFGDTKSSLVSMRTEQIECLSADRIRGHNNFRCTFTVPAL
jgi:hypothetical protein